MEGFDDAGGGVGGAADGVDFFGACLRWGEAVPAVEESGGGDAVDVAGGFVVGEEFYGYDFLIFVEGDEEWGFAGVAADVVAGGLGVGDVAEHVVSGAVDLGPLAFDFCGALGFGVEGLDVFGDLCVG